MITINGKVVPVQNPLRGEVTRMVMIDDMGPFDMSYLEGLINPSMSGGRSTKPNESEQQMSENAAQLPPAPTEVDAHAKISIEYMSTKGGILSADNAVFKGGVDFVILAAETVKSYFEGKYEEGVEKFPDCISVGGDFPSKNSPNPQAADCASCPKGNWQGRKAPECKERVKIIGIRVVGDDKGKRINPTLSVINIPPTSVQGTAKFPGGYAGYLSQLNLGQGRAKQDVITHIDVESNAPKASGYRLEFKNVGDRTSLGTPETIFDGFTRMAKVEAKHEPKPKEDDDAAVEQKAAENAGTETKPTGKGKKF